MASIDLIVFLLVVDNVAHHADQLHYQRSLPEGYPPTPLNTMIKGDFWR